MGLIELLRHTQLMTLCCQCRWEWPSFPCNCLGLPDYHSKYISHSLTFIFLDQWKAQCCLYLQRHGKHYNLITANINHRGRIFQRFFNLIPFVQVCCTLNSFHRSTFYCNSSSLQELLCFLCYLNTVELCFFEPSLKIEIGFRKLGVQRIKEMLSLVFGLWAFLPFSYWESPRRLRGRKRSFNLHNQEVQRTRISRIQYQC